MPSAYVRRNQFFRRWSTRAVFWLGALAVGGVAVGFQYLCDWALAAHDRLLSGSGVLTWLIALALPPAGLVTIGYITRHFAPGSEGSGIPQAIAALEVPPGTPRTKLLSLRIAIGKIVLTMLGLLCGASIGREGPTVHVGASIMEALGRIARFPHEQVRRSLILAGAAAGIAAAFNTPIAGIVFAVEELARSFEERTTGTLLTAVVLSGVVSLACLGNYTYFGSYVGHLPTLASWRIVPVCGVVGGLAGGLFSRLLIDGQRRLAPLYRSHPVRLAAGLGLILALLGLISGGSTYGSGYEQARLMLAGGPDSGLGAFAPLKALATLVSYLSGIPGGIFSPTLATGAGFGAELSRFVPEAPYESVVLLGMAAYFVGTIQSPLTGAVIVMEMVDDHELILPMLATSFIALLVSRIVCPKPIYHTLAESLIPGSGAPPIEAPAADPAPAAREPQESPESASTPAGAVSGSEPDAATAEAGDSSKLLR